MNFLGVLKDWSGDWSSKRIFALGSGLLVFVAAIGNMFFSVAIAEYIFQGLMYMAMVGIFGVAVEPFAARFGGWGSGITGSSTTFGEGPPEGGLIGREE